MGVSSGVGELAKVPRASTAARPPQAAESMFDHLHEALPPDLAPQRAAVAGAGADRSPDR